MKKQYYRNLFILSDLLASSLTWSIFFIYRKLFIETVKFGIAIPIHADFKFLSGLVIIPLFWFLIHYSTGAYNEIRRKTIARNTFQLFTVTLIGSFIILFFIILDDEVISYRNYYQSFLIFLSLQFFISFLFRSMILLHKSARFRKNKDEFNVLIIGSSKKIEDFTRKNEAWLRKSYLKITGRILSDPTPGFNEEILSGKIENLNSFIQHSKAEEVFIIADDTQKEFTDQLLLKLFRENVYIRVLPELYPVISVPVKFTDINAPLLLLAKDLLSPWQHSIKTLTDIFLSTIAILLLIPLIIILSVIIKLTSKGPVIYSHERIGKNGVPFKILKFRSMYVGSEPEGPQLTTKLDTRVTPVGRFMRKRRLDEIPNFINVFKGDMSLVGPRPERLFFIEQIIVKAPQYAKLHLVKPGITSWGQVKYGYAENIDEMIKRMRYDLVYIENMSLYADLQILYKTIGTIVKGKGI